MDGHVFEINKKTVTQPGDVEVYDDEGMPYKDDPSRFGRLYVYFKVEFPTHLSAE